MKLVFYSVVLNHHQAPVADEFYKLLGDEYCFVELINLGDNKGATDDYSKRPYLLRAWESPKNYNRAMELARIAECCVFSGVQSLSYMKERLKLGLLSFDMGERWLKQGLKNVLSPSISKMALAYYLNGWKHKPLYKLCMSAFAAADHARLGMYKGKCYKWGYFTSVPEVASKGFNDSNALSGSNSSKNLDQAVAIEQLKQRSIEPEHIVRLMWCARFLKLKHPEIPVLMAARLKEEGYSFVLDYYGAGEELDPTKQLAENLELNDCVKFHGAVPNNQVLEAMHQHDIFLFTSNRLEGWGAVVNEAMSCGCVVVGSDAIGSVPYLVEDGVTGYGFKSGNVTSLYEKIKLLLDHPNDRLEMQKNAYSIMQKIWSPGNAAKSLLQLIDDLNNGKDTSIKEGPCSKA